MTGVDANRLPPNEARHFEDVVSQIFQIREVHVGVHYNVSSSDVGHAVDFYSVPDTWEYSHPNVQIKSVNGDTNGFISLAHGSVPVRPEAIQKADVRVISPMIGQGNDANTFSYLLPPTGITVLSDIDDLLGDTQIWRARYMIHNAFFGAKPWMNMPDVYRHWASVLPKNNTHWHYLTTLPQQFTNVYLAWLDKHQYPPGSLDTRDMSFVNNTEIVHPRHFMLEQILQTFPNRRFILLGDTSNADSLIEYAAAALKYPDTVQCVLIRDVLATLPNAKIKVKPNVFWGVPLEKYMFFERPDDIRGLNFAAGDCRIQAKAVYPRSNWKCNMPWRLWPSNWLCQVG